MFSACARILPYVYHIHQTLFFVVGMCLLLPALFIPWICITVGCLVLLMESYFKETLAAISNYANFALPVWFLVTSVMLMVLHWPVLVVDDKVLWNSSLVTLAASGRQVHSGACARQ